MICPTGEAKYFCKGDSTHDSKSSPMGKSPTPFRRTLTTFLSRLLQKLRAQHQALDLVGAAFDLVGIVGEVNAFDHGAAFQHRGGAFQLQVLDQRDAVALGEQRAV